MPAGVVGSVSFHIHRKVNISQCRALFHILHSKIFHLSQAVFAAFSVFIPADLWYTAMEKATIVS